MKVQFSVGEQFKSFSIIPGIDICWHYKTIGICFVFMKWNMNIDFVKD